jgi:adenosylhomocysteine nucleosidase
MNPIRKPKVDLAIMSAMIEEIKALLEAMTKVTKVTKGRRNYYSGNLFGKKVVAVFSRWGKVASAATTTQLINDFEIGELLFTGVGGAIRPELDIGDIVLADRLFQYDMDTSPLFKPFEIPLLGKEFISAQYNPELIAATEHFISDYQKFVAMDEAAHFGIDRPSCVTGDIASGDQFVSSSEAVNRLNKLLPSALCVEMEGAAVAQVCYEYTIPFSVIRIISDKANDNATIDFQRFASSIASHYALGILHHYLG